MTGSRRTKIARRTLLARTGAGVVLGSLVLSNPSSQNRAATDPSDLRQRWIEIITARASLDATDSRIKKHLRSMDDDVASYMSQMDGTSANSVFSAYTIDGVRSSPFTLTTARLAVMARAWATPASSWAGSRQLKDQLITGVTKVIEGGYHAGARTFDNWWDWEIGTPGPLSDVLCIMLDELTDDLAEEIQEAVHHFAPDPKFSPLLDAPTTAANRVDMSRGALVTAIVTGDRAWADRSVDALSTAWEIVHEGDGFHADGGFIQHDTVAYTGSYGMALISAAAPLLRLIEGTPLGPIDHSGLRERVDTSFLPVMVNGHMLDFVRGRAVARTRMTGSRAGLATLSAIAQLAHIASVDERERWTALMHQWAGSNRSVDLLDGADLPSAVALTAAARTPRRASDEPLSAYFPSMDRAVHRAPGWTCAIAMCSNRVAAYEASTTENTWGSRTGNMMRYVFVDDDPTPFDDQFWSTLDYSRPPGTTNNQAPIRPKPSGAYPSKTPQNEWTGGMVHGSISVAAMHQVGLEDDVPRCRRLTVATEERIIELATDIPRARNPFTTVENRLFPQDSTPELVVNGHEVKESRTVPSARWAHLEGVGGYLFLTRDAVSAHQRSRGGSATQVERPIGQIAASERVTRRWATLELAHDAGKGSAWMILPGASRLDSKKEADRLQGRTDTFVRRNDAVGQILTVRPGVTVAAAWRPLTVQVDPAVRVHCPHAVLLLTEITDQELSLRITEPTQERTWTRVSITGDWTITGRSGISAASITTESQGDRTLLRARTEDQEGRSFRVRLRRA